MKKVRVLLRVSSDQQLEADGDLSIQRQIVHEYVNKHDDWYLDPDKEYFEGSQSAYKNTASERDELQKILYDAKKREFDILVLYKDDRIGRLLLDTTQYIMELKKYGVDVYTVKDGCITPESEDVMGQLMLAIRFANAQKSSADTGLRVRDTAMKLVEHGKFMGGAAPYGYRLEYSGQVSKHGRALKKLVVVPEQAEVVRHIYDLSLRKEYGSSKLARLLNQDDYYKNMAPKDVWKSGTITSIITNPIYSGHVAYKRRERVNGMYHRLDSQDWIISEKADEGIAIISEEVWNLTQDKRKLRGGKYIKSLENQDVAIMKHNSGELPLIDVACCGYCMGKLTNGTKYNYWTIKSTGERRASKIAIYKCQNAWQGIPHEKTYQFKAEELEPIIFSSLADYIGKLQENQNVFDEIEFNHKQEQMRKETEIKKDKQELTKLIKNIEIMEDKIPEAMQGDYALSLDELMNVIRKQKEKQKELSAVILEKEEFLQESSVSYQDWDDIRKNIPTWQEVFLNADASTKRVLVNKLIDKIYVKKDEVVIRFKIDLSEFAPQSRITDDSGTTPCKPGSK